jgi:uncharacterized protein
MFTPLQTGLGALLLHQATSNLLFHNGKVFGASSILGNSLSGAASEDGCILAGMAVGAGLVRVALPRLMPLYGSAGQWWRVGITAAMVGWGTKVCFFTFVLNGARWLALVSLCASGCWLTCPFLS